MRSVKLDAPYTLYAFPHSLYSGKVRSYLRYKRIPYREVLATLRVYARVLVPRTGVRVVPVIQSPDNIVVQDSTEIIDFLETRFPAPAIYPATPRQKLVTLLFELYADEWLLLPAMYYRWAKIDEPGQADDIYANFGLLAGGFLPHALRRRLGRVFAAPFRGALKMLGMTPKNYARIEAWYESFLAQMDAHFARHDYLLGGAASMGDFGLMAPLYAHLARDPYPKRQMQRVAPNVYRWVERMNALDPGPGGFLAGDAVPETLLPVLRHMFAEHWPVLIDTAAHVEAYLENHPRQPFPRTIGWHAVSIGGVSEQRAVFPYSQWMMQRPLSCYAQLGDADRASADALLREVGGFEAMQTRIRRPVKRLYNRLFADPAMALRA